MELTGVEKDLMSRNVIAVMQMAGERITYETFVEYATKRYPFITQTGIVNLWAIYQADQTI